MSTGSNPNTKSSRAVLIVVGILALAGVALVGRDVLARRAAAPSPTSIAIAPGGGDQTPLGVPGETPVALMATPAPIQAATANSTATPVVASGETPVGLVATPAPTQAVPADPTATPLVVPDETPVAPIATLAPDSVTNSTPTPFVVTPTALPKDLFDAATRAVEATALAQKIGTATPPPPNMSVATFTPMPLIVTPTATPANATTAEYVAAVATAMAVTTGTPTTPPGGLLIATDTPTATPPPTIPPTPIPTSTPTITPVPILVPITPKPYPLAVTPTPLPVIPSALAGKILFYSDRAGSPQLFALDPADGQLFAVTQEWPYAAALAREGRSPDGNLTAEVQMVTVVTAFDIPNNRPSETQTTSQVFVRDNQYNVANRLTTANSGSYDPVWSPAADRIAFVSTEPGNDEIYSISLDGSNMQRLTSNTWEWDKHPSWSPDGNQIVFMSNRGSNRRQLWVMNADGSDQRQLLDSPSNDWDPIWVKYAE